MTISLKQLIFSENASSKEALKGSNSSILLGWRYTSLPIDEGAGLPQVAKIIAPALVSNFCILFLTSNPTWHGDTQTQTWQWKEDSNKSWVGRLKSWAFGIDRLCSKRIEHAPVVWTRNATDAEKVFEPELWCLGGQVAFLTRHSKTPPQLHRSILKTIARDLSKALWDLRGNPSIRGLLLPGHDGAWARLFLFYTADWSRVRNDLEATAKTQGLNWQEIHPDKFFSGLAGINP